MAGEDDKQELSKEQLQAILDQRMQRIAKRVKYGVIGFALFIAYTVWFMLHQ